MSAFPCVGVSRGPVSLQASPHSPGALTGLGPRGPGPGLSRQHCAAACQCRPLSSYRYKL